jgi:hypothetical protein
MTASHAPQPGSAERPDRGFPLRRLAATAALTILLGACLWDDLRPAFGLAAEAPLATEAAPAHDAHTRMGTIGEGGLTLEGFLARFPTLRKEAFTAIDLDRDGIIDQQEWETFRTRHASGMGKQGGAAPHQDGPSPFPLVDPPDGHPAGGRP